MFRLFSSLNMKLARIVVCLLPDDVKSVKASVQYGVLCCVCMCVYLLCRVKGLTECFA